MFWATPLGLLSSFFPRLGSVEERARSDTPSAYMHESTRAFAVRIAPSRPNHMPHVCDHVGPTGLPASLMER